LVWKLGVPLTQTETLFGVLEFFTALLTLVLCLIAARRWDEPTRAYLLLALAACYLLLMNPRTEANSYVMLAPLIAVPAALLLLTLDRSTAGWALVVLCVLLTCDGWAYKWTEYWLKPIVCLIFLSLLIGEFFQSPQPQFQT
jgi:cell division protein FtsW (lipid II flippase)